jgi:hypothetical protein
MTKDEIDLIFNAPPIPKCAGCGKLKGDHKAGSLACPIGGGKFPQFYMDRHYEPKAERSAKR